MRRSRAHAAESRERIVSTAATMFLERGLGAVGMREIMAAASLTQGGFYRHFESREQLIAEANAVAADRLLLALEKEVADQSPQQALQTLTSRYLGQTRGKSGTLLCPLAMLGAELSHCDEQVRGVAAEAHARLVRLIAHRLPDLPEAEALSVAGGIVSTLVGAVTLANLVPDRASSSRILQDAQTLIHTRLSAPKAPLRRAAKRSQEIP